VRSSLGGKLGRELTRLGQMANSLRQVTSYRTRTSLTTQGVHREPIAPAGRGGAVIRPALVVDETLQWLKCTFDLAYTSGDTTFVWVAKPPDLRVPLPALTPEVYAAYVWNGTFAGETFLYRNAAERLRRFTAANLMFLHRGFTMYEAWPSATNRTNIDTYAVSGAGATPWDADRIGAVDWFYDFQVVYPVYTLFTGTSGDPETHTGQNRRIYVTRLHASDEVMEEPEDETFAGSVKYLDLNVGGRCWREKRAVYPRWMVQLNDGGTTTPDLTGDNAAGFAAFPPQFNDQLFANANPAIKTELGTNYWTEI
jgi:hypothetical protein